MTLKSLDDVSPKPVTLTTADDQHKTFLAVSVGGSGNRCSGCVSGCPWRRALLPARVLPPLRGLGRGRAVSPLPLAVPEVVTRIYI